MSGVDMGFPVRRGRAPAGHRLVGGGTISDTGTVGELMCAKTKEWGLFWRAPCSDSAKTHQSIYYLPKIDVPEKHLHPPIQIHRGL